MRVNYSMYISNVTKRVDQTEITQSAEFIILENIRTGIN